MALLFTPGDSEMMRLLKVMKIVEEAADAEGKQFSQDEITGMTRYLNNIYKRESPTKSITHQKVKDHAVAMVSKSTPGKILQEPLTKREFDLGQGKYSGKGLRKDY